ncbi:hypothetical protein AAY473_005702 [Plecturocebus cupreus]
MWTGFYSVTLVKCIDIVIADCSLKLLELSSPFISASQMSSQYVAQPWRGIVRTVDFRRFTESAGGTLPQLNREHLSVPRRLRRPAGGVKAARGVPAQTRCVSRGRSRASSSGPNQEALPSLQGHLKRTQAPPPQGLPSRRRCLYRDT